MRVLVTGARGFIGRHLARRLSEGGARVVGVGHGAWPDCADWGVSHWQNGEVSGANLDVLSNQEGLPDAIVHLAGGSAVGPSLAAPAEDFRRSVGATADLLEWMRLRAPQARLVMASSAAVYGDGHSGPIREDARCRPYSPYGMHKFMAETEVGCYASAFGLRTAIVRLFSVYGPELRKQLLWDACARLSRGEPLVLGGSGAETRDWLHVEDAAHLLSRVIDHADTTAPVFNGGTGIGVDVLAIANRLCECVPNAQCPTFSGKSRPGDPRSLVADITKSSAIGFRPAVRWRDGVRDYADWYFRKVLPGNGPNATNSPSSPRS